MKLFRSRKRPVSREVTHCGGLRGEVGEVGGGGEFRMMGRDGGRRKKEGRGQRKKKKMKKEKRRRKERRKKKGGTNLANFRKSIRENVSVHRGPKRGEPRTVNQPGKIREHWTRGRQTSRKTLTTRMVLF